MYTLIARLKTKEMLITNIVYDIDNNNITNKKQ